MQDAQVGILNVGAGDTKLSFDPKNPAERARAAKIVTDMLRQGYAIMVQVGKRKGEPLYQRAKEFDPKTCEYIITGGGPDEEVNIGREHAEKPKKHKAQKLTSVRLPAARTHAVAVARSAGG